MRKEKVNLTIDTEVIKKAKEQGVNISKFVGRVLGGYVAANKPESDVHEAYNQFFESIVPLLKEFDCRVQVADSTDPSDFEDSKGNVIKVERPISIYIMPNGSLYLDEDDRYFKDIKEIPTEDFFEPKKILSNVVNALLNSKEARDDRLNEILMAKNIIEAMSKRLVKKYKLVK